MSLFGTLFGKNAAPKQEPEAPKGPGAPVSFFPDGVNMSDWDQVFSACLGKMYTVQHAFLDLVRGEEGWYIDFEKGALTLGKQEFQVQFLGSESYASNSWLWGWENINNFPNSVLGQAQIARTYGQTWGLEPLMYPQCELNGTFNGHNFSMVVCGALAEDRCYYRCPTAGGQGAAFVALCDMPKELFAPVDGITFINSVSQCIQQFYLDHKIFVEAFLRWNKTPFDWSGDILTAHFDADVAVEFEQAGENYRIKNLSQTVKP
jgi:hypothetical protein